MMVVTLGRYGFAVVVCGFALALALPLDAPSSCFFLAVMASSLWGGKGPGFLSVGLSALAFDYFFVPTRFHLFANPASGLRVAAFLGSTFLVTGIIEIKRRVEESRERERLADLKKSEDELRQTINTIPTLAWSARPDGSSEFFNQRWLDYTGLSADQARDWGWKLAIHPDDLDPLVNYWQSVLSSGKQGETEARLRNVHGEYRWFLFRASPMRDERGKVIKWYGTNTDIEDRRRAEEAAAARERELALIIETMPALVWCASLDGELTYVNQRVLDYVGATLDSLMQSGWLNFLHPDDVDPTWRAWRHAVAAGVWHETQYRLRRFDGAYRWFQVLGQLRHNGEGQTTRWYGLLIDINDRKNMEEALRSTQARLSRATQIATVGELSASIAHEINQPLAAVVANGHACLRWLSAQPPNLPKAREAAERIVRDGKEAAEVVRQVRALFKRASIEQAALDLNEIIGEVLRLLDGETRKRRVTVETDLEEGLARVAGDRVQLQQVLFNLLLNGIEAMDTVIDRPKKLSVRSKCQSPETVLVEVRDYGVGLQDPEKIFEAFFTTKEKGMGMGLAICRSIIEAHRGRLWAAHADGAGASFCFTLPIQTNLPVQAEPRP
jgi:hypothetical protein